jgi:polar amino acid transport system substrate-binding protein
MVSCFIGTILGSIICYLRLSKLRIAEVFAKTYVKIVGGIPELVLLLIFYYVVFARGHQSPLFMAITAFSLNFAARVSVIFQKSIETIDKRQPEAALTLGFNKFQTFLYVTLPQALRTILPLYQMRLINLVWWTSVVGYISVHDLTMAGRIVQQKTLDSFMPFLLVGVIYMLIAWFITYIISKFEFRLDPHKRRPSISVK